MGRSAGTIFIAVKGDLDPLDRALQAAYRASDKRSKQIEKAFTRMERRVKRAWKSMTSGIGGAIAGLSLGALITETIALADKYTLLQSRIKLVTTSAENYADVNDRLFKISQGSRTAYETTVEIFTRLSRATKNTSISQEEMLKVTDALNKATVVSGATTTEATNALIQLSQGLASNRLGGEELRSVMEQIPYVAQQIAEGLGVDIGKFREMSKEGLLTTETVVNAFIKQVGVIEKEYGKMPVTVSQAWIMVTNATGQAIGKINESIGVTETLSEAMQWLANVLTIVSDDMDRYLHVTATGLEAIAKIAVAGGALWSLPIIITKAHTAFSLLGLTVFKMQTGVLGLNSSLYGTSVSADLASGSLSKMKLATSGLMALFIGWELGKWANENFEEVRLAGLSAVAGLDEQWIKFKFGLQQIWIDIKFGFMEMAGGINRASAELIEGIADKFSGVSFTIKNPFGEDFQFGLDAASEKLGGLAEKIKESGDYTKEHVKATSDLNQQYTKAIEIHNRTIDIIAEERTWEKKLGETREEETENYIDNEEKKVEAKTEANDAIRALEEDLNGKIIELKDGEFWHKTYLLEQEVAKMEETARSDQALQDQIAEYHELKQDQIYEDFEKKQDEKEEKLFDSSEALKSINQSVVSAFVRGENVKVALARTAQDQLIEYATGAATKGLPKILEGLGEAVGAWIGLGTAETQTEGDSWVTKLASGASYLAGATAAVLAGKAVGNNFADGGWLSRNPGGGTINEGSRVADDVLLSVTKAADGAPIFNMGMGGEFVNNKESTRNNYGILNYINTYGRNKKLFANGGELSDFEQGLEDWEKGLGTGKGDYKNAWEDRPPVSGAVSGTVSPNKVLETTESITNSGMTVIGSALLGSIFDFGASLSDIIGYYAGAALGMIGGKAIGKELFEKGGYINTFSVGGLISEAAGLLLDVFGFSEDDIWNELRSLDAISKYAEMLDAATLPFVRDTATAGKSIDAGTFEDSIRSVMDEFYSNFLVDALWELIPGGDLLSDIFANGGLLGSYAAGTSYVPQTGPYMLHEGERVLTADENESFMAMLRNGIFGSGDIKVEVNPQIKVMIGTKELKDVMIDVTDDYNAKKTRRGAGRTRYGTIG